MHYKFEVLTVRDINFKDDQGKEVTGYQLWLLEASQDPKWHGYEVTKLWIPCGSPLESSVQQLRHGDQVNIVFNRRGKAESINLI